MGASAMWDGVTQLSAGGQSLAKIQTSGAQKVPNSGSSFSSADIAFYKEIRLRQMFHHKERSIGLFDFSGQNRIQYYIAGSLSPARASKY